MGKIGLYGPTAKERLAHWPRANSGVAVAAAAATVMAEHVAVLIQVLYIVNKGVVTDKRLQKGCARGSEP